MASAKKQPDACRAAGAQRTPEPQGWWSPGALREGVSPVPPVLSVSAESREEHAHRSGLTVTVCHTLSLNRASINTQHPFVQDDL